MIVMELHENQFTQRMIPFLSILKCYLQPRRASQRPQQQRSIQDSKGPAIASQDSVRRILNEDRLI